MVSVKSKKTKKMYEFDSKYGFWGTPFFDQLIYYPEFDKSVRVIHDRFGNRSTLNQSVCDLRSRALFLGGSHTWGAGVNNNETYPALFEAQSNFKAVNLAHCSMGLDQMALVLKNKIDALKPDYVFLEMHPWVVHRILRKSAIGFPKPYFSSTGSYTFHKLPRIMKINLFRNITSKYREFVKAYEEYLADIRLDSISDAFKDPIFHLWKMRYYEPMYNLAEYLFTSIREETAKHGAKLIVILGPTLQELRNINKKSELINFSLPRNKLVEILKKNNIEFIDFLENSDHFNSKNIEEIMFADGHLNEAGHKVIAARIIDKVL